MKFNSYIKIISEESIGILNSIHIIKKAFNDMLLIKNINETFIDRTNYYVSFKNNYLNIEIELDKIVKSLYSIRNYCYDDLNKLAIFLNLNIETDLDIVKNINNSKKLLMKQNISSKDLEILLNDMKMNENIRFFIHQVMNILSITKPIFISRVFDKEISKNEIIKDNKFIVSKLFTYIYQIEKFEKELNSLNTIHSDNDIIIETINLTNVIEFIEIYKDKINEYPYSGDIFDINLTIENKLSINSIKSNEYKLEEMIDVILNNGCEELSSKEIFLSKKIEKEIKVILHNNKVNLYIYIIDNGRGIKNIDKIFEPYFTTKAASGGSGIGLAAANMIIKSLNGKLKVKISNNGSAFIIKLPIKEI